MNNITREYLNFCSLFCHLWSLLSFSSVQGSSDSHSFPQKLYQILFCLSFTKGTQQEIFHHRGLLFHPGAVAEPQAQPHWRLYLTELSALDSYKSIAPTPYLQICRWSRSHPPDARTHKLSPLTTMRASVFQTTDSTCIAFSALSGSGSWSCRVLENTRSISFLRPLMLGSLLTSSCSFFIWQHCSQRGHISCSVGSLLSLPQPQQEPSGSRRKQHPP